MARHKDLEGEDLDDAIARAAMTHHETLDARGITYPPGEIFKLTWVARDNDWYAETDAGSFWYDARKKRWKSMRSAGPCDS